ncbi:hypothetical protein Slin14017_G128230 [Septoria linicola]|nr:hypothetical protein Slin14017_G128230 [Septoria linicola]
MATTNNSNPNLVQLSQDREKIGNDTHTYVRRVLQVPVQHGEYTVVHKEEREHHIETPASRLSDLAIHDAQVVTQEVAIRYEGMIVHLEWLTTFQQDSDHGRAPTVAHTWRNGMTVDFAHLLAAGGGHPIAAVETPSLASLFHPTMPPHAQISLSAPIAVPRAPPALLFAPSQPAEAHVEGTRHTFTSPAPRYRAAPAISPAADDQPRRPYAAALASHAASQRGYRPCTVSRAEPSPADSDEESVVDVTPTTRKSVRADSLEHLITKSSRGQNADNDKGELKRKTRGEVDKARKQAKQAYNAAKKQLEEWGDDLYE